MSASSCGTNTSTEPSTFSIHSAMYQLQSGTIYCTVQKKEKKMKKKTRRIVCPCYRESQFKRGNCSVLSSVLICIVMNSQVKAHFFFATVFEIIFSQYDQTAINDTKTLFLPLMTNCLIDFEIMQTEVTLARHCQTDWPYSKPYIQLHWNLLNFTIVTSISDINIVEFAECRARELIAMNKISHAMSGNKLPQQTIP